MSSTTLLILWFFSPILLRKQYIGLIGSEGFGATNALCIFSQIPYLITLMVLLAVLGLLERLAKLAVWLIQLFLTLLGKISQMMIKFQNWFLTGDSNELTKPPR